MARLHPTLPPRAAITLGDRAELDVLERLGQELPNAYTLFHTVEWSATHQGFGVHGEADIVVVNRAGDVLVLEIKSGQVRLSDRGITKTPSTPAQQVRRSHSGGAVKMAPLTCSGQEASSFDGAGDSKHFGDSNADFYPQDTPVTPISSLRSCRSIANTAT